MVALRPPWEEAPTQANDRMAMNGPLQNESTTKLGKKISEA
jgi:hypothetical protein